MAKLVVLTEGLAGTVYELKGDRITVGRVEDNQIQVVEPSVSSHHCELLVKGSEVQVKDLGSTNGTFINGDQIKEATLKAGQTLRLGKIELRFDDGTQPASTAAPAPAAGPAAAAPKKQQATQVAQTAGVKMNELEHHEKTVGSPFAKKSNSANKWFLWGGLGLLLLIIALIVYAISQLN